MERDSRPFTRRPCDSDRHRRGGSARRRGGDRVQGFDVATGQRIWSIYSQGEGVTWVRVGSAARPTA